MADLIQVFARSPEAGRVKTRLIPALGAEGACSVYRHLLDRTLGSCLKTPAACVQIWSCGDNQAQSFKAWLSDDRVTLHAQQGADLGSRMAHALEQGLMTHRRVILVGCDCPDLNPGILEQALNRLDTGRPVVIGPAHDGGYYLIGATTQVPDIFSKMPWGTGRVLTATRQRLAELGLGYSEVSVLHDVDEPGDLCQLGTEVLLEILPDLDQELMRMRCCLDLRSSLPTSC